MSYVDVAAYPWSWHWRVNDDEEADCGIFAEVREGHAYAVVRCPRYMKRNEWIPVAEHICNLHNAALTADKGANQ